MAEKLLAAAAAAQVIWRAVWFVCTVLTLWAGSRNS